MKCPKCGVDLPSGILSNESLESETSRCYHCGKKISPEILKQIIAPEDCFACQDGELDKECFDPEYDCRECMRSECVLAENDIVSDFGMVQDAEGNWCYPEDIEENEEE